MNIFSNNLLFTRFSVYDSESWKKALRFSFISSLLFFIYSSLIYTINSDNIALILLGPFFLFISFLLSFIFMVSAGGILSAITWFILGSGIYFGFGVIAGGLNVHPYSIILFGNDPSYLLKVNLLNSIAILIIISISFSFEFFNKKKTIKKINYKFLFIKFFPFLLILVILSILLRLIYFPIAENLILRSLIDKILLFTPLFFIATGYLWKNLDYKFKFFLILVIFIYLFIQLIIFSKYQIMLPIISLYIGFILNNKLSVFKIFFFTIIFPSFIFFVINPIITNARAHIDYDPFDNNFLERSVIVGDAINILFVNSIFNIIDDKDSKFYKKNNPLDNKFTFDTKSSVGILNLIKSFSRRFDVATVQGFLIKSYDKGKKGSTMQNPFLFFIPRILWPSKPILTNHGIDLYVLLYSNYNEKVFIERTSSVAPTFVAEAYWNYGFKGVVYVSIFFGLFLIFLTNCWKNMVKGLMPSYLFVAFPFLILFLNVESWILGTFFGNSVIYLFILVSLILIMKLFKIINYKDA